MSTFDNYCRCLPPQRLAKGKYWCLACSDTKCKVEFTHVMSVGFISIIGRNTTDACPGWFPLWIICMKPAHAGLGDRGDSDVFHGVVLVFVNFR